MRKRSLFAGVTAGAAGVGVLLFATSRKGLGSRSADWRTGVRFGLGAAVGSLLGMAGEALTRVPEKVALMEDLMPKTEMIFSFPRVEKPVPTDLFMPKGTGTDFETRPSAWGGFITSNDRFYLRSHSPTPKIDVDSWRLKIDGTGVERPVELAYADLEAFPQVTLIRTMECAGNGRRFYKEHFGVEGKAVNGVRVPWATRSGPGFFCVTYSRGPVSSRQLAMSCQSASTTMRCVDQCHSARRCGTIPCWY